MATDIALLSKRLMAAAAGNPRRDEAMKRIGMLLRNQTVINITKKSDRANGVRKGLIKFESLRDSINYKPIENGIVVGSFGIPYAAIHEFGFKGLVQVREFLRRGGVHVRAHQRNMNIPARPFLRPAVVKHKDLILTILREAFHL